MKVAVPHQKPAAIDKLTVYLSEELRRALRVRAAEQDTSMSALAEKAIRVFVGLES